MNTQRKSSARDFSIARILRTLGTQALSKLQAQRAAQLLGVHCSTVYRWRKRFLADPVASALACRPCGPSAGSRRLQPEVDVVITETLTKWLPRQRVLGAPLNDLTIEIRRACRQEGLTPPSRHTVARRWMRHKEAQATQLASDPSALIAPGHLTSHIPLEWVQIDHTQADLFVVNESNRQPIGRPWLSVAIDVATRCVVAIYVAMERPNAATVALLLTRVVLPKAQWLRSIGVDLEWPMHGILHCLYLDKAAEFKSKALRTACAQYGIDLTYRPFGKPHFGGHVERMNRTLMDCLRGVPGATGNSVKGRKDRKPRKIRGADIARV